MHVTAIKSCYIGPEISPEEFIKEHFFLYLAKGKIEGYDGHRKYSMEEGDCCIVRKNHLARYNKQKNNGEFEKVVIILDEVFLKAYQQQYQPEVSKNSFRGAFIFPEKTGRIFSFIHALMPYYEKGKPLGNEVADAKRIEFLQLLLHENPSLSNVLFDFRVPDKLDIEAYMIRNYKFNVSIARFAYLTGRSLSAFKRDFAAVFGDTPHRWLKQKRLQEAHFLLEKKQRKPSDVYLELGFEDLSHFSFAFKQKFGKNPSELLKVVVK